jgi:arylsulfatase A-like enzyme
MILSRRAAVASLAGPLWAARRPPNVVVILADDLGVGDVRSYHPAARTETPHLDALARQGMRFTDAHSPSSVCTPTRYGLLTGRYCWRTSLKRGVLEGYSPSLLEPGRATIASFLRQQGYRTGGFGKWHLGLGRSARVDYAQEFSPSPNDFGFDEYFGIPASLDMPPYVYIENRRAVEQPVSTIATNGAPPRGAFWRGGPIAPSFRMEEVLPKLVGRACQFIARRSPQPFFAYVPLTGPHTPWVPLQRGQSRAGLYGDFVREVDAAIGRVLGAIRESGQERNTLVIVTSDNGAPWSQPDIDQSGGHRANADWRGQKADTYEGGHRIPFLVRWPGRVKPNTVSSALVCLTDVFATVADSTGAPLTPGMAEDSFSFGPVLRGQQRNVRESIVHHSQSGVFVWREANWKLQMGRGSGGFTPPQKIDPAAGEPEGELYDLAADPHERRNLWADRPDVVARLQAALQRVQQQGFSRPDA